MVKAKQENQHADLVVRLVGPGVDPQVVSIRALARILGAVQRLIDQRDDYAEADDQESSETVAEDPDKVLHLLDVTSGSAAYLVGTAQREVVYGLLDGIASAIKNPSASEWLDSTISSLKELSEVSKSLGCGIEFCVPSNGKAGRVIASINDHTYERVKDSAFLFGLTSVYAVIENVGGSTSRHCHIRLPQYPRKMVVCRVESDDLVRQLGQHIYEYVVLTGRATWLRHNWRLKRLEISGFSPPKKGSLQDTLKKMRELGGGAWDRIDDPDGYIAKMRRL